MGQKFLPARRSAGLTLLLLLCSAPWSEAQTIRLRSIGTAPNRTTGGGDGTVAATNGSPVVTGTGTSWQTWNRGRGDVITINAVNYMVLRVDSQTQLQLATPFTGPTGSGAFPELLLIYQLLGDPALTLR